ncbi:MAG: Type 1 glutamine amidotransferase-like domain-containing protein [bacterium]|nr:Type 1 glutamine amidotransferase-like domain-containing protein [bacterium]
MQVHLFGSTGEPPLQKVVDTVFSLLRNHRNPIVLYLPPTFRDEHAELTRQKFRDVAEVNTIDLSKVNPSFMKASLEKASFLFIPGGNTYLLNLRLHQSGIFEEIAKSVKSGLPYLGISAGTLICGENILTTSDINGCGTTYFSGFGLTQYNFVAHYPDLDNLEREKIDDRISAYHLFHENPVIALNDQTYILISENGLNVKSGDCWLFRKDNAKVQIKSGGAL